MPEGTERVKKNEEKRETEHTPAIWRRSRRGTSHEVVVAHCPIAPHVLA